MIKKLLSISIFTIVFSACNSNQMNNDTKSINTKKEQALGKRLFFDTILSKNDTQSCSTCHNPKHGFIDNRKNIVKGAGSLGDDFHSIGDRNTPMAAYAMFSPEFHYNEKTKQYLGGQFYDGREKNLKEQAKGPPTNPVEMGIPSKDFLANKLKNDTVYNELFKELYGKDIFLNPINTYDKMAQAIASFETTKEFAPFNSKYDRYLDGKYDLTVLEDLGRTLFFSNNNNNCASCHVLKKEDAKRETFSNYEYHNIGTPKNLLLNAKNVVDAKTFIDHGLMNNKAIKNLKNAKQYDGKIKVPSLRNIAITAPYMHNGTFAKLSTVIKFYDKYVNEKQNINPETNKAWEEPEVKIAKDDMKILKNAKKLTKRKEKALLAFLNLLTDKRYEHLIPKDN